MEKPENVPDDLVHQVQQYVAKSWPCVVEPGLIEQSGSRPGDLVPFPSELITSHVRTRNQAGASETQIDQELDYLMHVFQQAAAKVKAH